MTDIAEGENAKGCSWYFENTESWEEKTGNT